MVGETFVTAAREYSESLAKAAASQAEAARLQAESQREVARLQAEAQREVARIQAEARIKEREFELEKARIEAAQDEKEVADDHVTQRAALQQEAVARQQREQTIRWVGGALVVGVLAFLIAALSMDKITDVPGTLGQLALVIGFMYTLVQNRAKAPPSPDDD